mmetsp:Transcript_7319/g.26912  ORF Transcript_7319/g.26912 Transcript_7319/m.26912 type:complete len:207 (+) Transcript_7319:269-889(+)
MQIEPVTFSRHRTRFPLFTNITVFFIFCLVFGSICARSLITSHSSTTVCTWSTHLYPAVKIDLCSNSSNTASCASNSVTARIGFCGEQRTNPDDTSSSSTPVSRKRMFSPGLARLTSPESRKTFATFTEHLFGISRRGSPRFILPDSILPIAITPMSLYLSITGILNGAAGSLSCGCKLSRNSKKLGVPSHQGHFSGDTLSFMLSP